MVWSVPRRVAFRFGVVALALYLLPFLPWSPLVTWFAEHVLGIDPPQRVFTGSGDTMFVWLQTLLIAILAAIGAAVWSAVDRRRAHPRLQGGVIVVLRYYLCMTMAVYGAVKLIELGQFPPLSPGRMDQSYGESSPMGLLWTFMGHSRAYTVFAGLAEITGGVLLLWRRTSVIGALISAAVMTNVVMLNMAYDVPVKLFSMQLLLCALLILLPHARRVIAALLGHAVPEVAPRVRGSRRVERLRLIAKLAFVGLTAFGLYQQLAWRTLPPKNELHGAWAVERFVAGGVERAPLITDEARWRKLIINERGAIVRAMTDRRDRFIAEVDPGAHTITLTIPETKQQLVWRYQRSGDRLIVDGTYRGTQVRVTLVKEPAPLLSTRGFHWVQEAPFNR